MIDLMYFGNSFEGPKIEKEFIELVRLAFRQIKYS